MPLVTTTEMFTRYTWTKGKSSVSFSNYVETESNMGILVFFSV